MGADEVFDKVQKGIIANLDTIIDGAVTLAELLDEAFETFGASERLTPRQVEDLSKSRDRAVERMNAAVKRMTARKSAQARNAAREEREGGTQPE